MDELTNDPQGGMQSIVETAMTAISEWGLQVIGAIAVLIIGRWVAGMIRRGVSRSLERTGTDASLVPFLSSIAYYLALTVVLIAVLNLFGIQTTSLVAVLGAAGLAVGFALQGTLSNFAAGVMILVFRPFGVGDFVEAGGTSGTIDEIGIFVTTLHTPDNVRIIVPNSEIGSGVIKNYSANDTRRVDLVAGISYADDIETAITTIRGVLERDSRVLADPEPTIAVSELADSSVNLVVRPWCAAGDYWPLKFDLTRALKEGLEGAGCSIPFPQQDLHLVEVPKTA